SPIRNASALRTEVKPELALAASHICLRRAGDFDAFVLVVIRPQNSVAPTRRAIARGRSFRLPFERPAHGAADAGTGNHTDILHDQSTPKLPKTPCLVAARLRNCRFAPRLLLTSCA